MESGPGNRIRLSGTTSPKDNHYPSPDTLGGKQ